MKITLSRKEMSSPFTQPFLVLHMDVGCKKSWYIDVGGNIASYLPPSSVKHLQSECIAEEGFLEKDLPEMALPALKALCKSLKTDHGVMVWRVGVYEGSAGRPTHILEGETLFEVVKLGFVEPTWMDA